MEIMKVEDYHRKIAFPKWEKDKTKPRSMFFFYRQDRKGYPTTIRKRGFVVCEENSYKFMLTL